jgi:hypothetical protein
MTTAIIGLGNVPGTLPFQPAGLTQVPEDLDAKGILQTLIGSTPAARVRRSIVPLAPVLSGEENIDGL